MKSRRYTLAEIKKHDTPDDLWMIIYNKVFDVTAFTKQHPGGAEVLFDCSGVDATEPFEDVGHSNIALKMLIPYYLGEVVENERKHYPNLSSSRSKLLEHNGEDGEDLFEKREQKRIEKEKRRKRIRNNLIKTYLLILLALGALLLYCTLQRIKWSYYLHSWSS